MLQHSLNSYIILSTLLIALCTLPIATWHLPINAKTLVLYSGTSVLHLHFRFSFLALIDKAIWLCSTSDRPYWSYILLLHYVLLILYSKSIYLLQETISHRILLLVGNQSPLVSHRLSFL